MTVYKFLPEAVEEMNVAARFYEEKSQGLGDDFLIEVERSIASILAHPSAGPAISPNLRRRILRRFPFAILYAIGKNEIVVVAVAHLKRKPGFWKERF